MLVAVQGYPVVLSAGPCSFCFLIRVLVRLVIVCGLPLGRSVHVEEVKGAMSCWVVGLLTTEEIKGDVVLVDLK